MRRAVPAATVRPTGNAPPQLDLLRRHLGHVLIILLTSRSALADDSPGVGGEYRARMPTEQVHVVPHSIARVAPGTVISDQAPRGWSDLIIKSGSFLSAGDIEEVSENERYYAKLFSTVMLADVRQQAARGGRGREHVLARVAVGCLTSIRQQDTVVSPATHKKLGADIGFLGNLLLSEIYKKQQGVMVVARSSSMAIIDAPLVVHHEGRNRLMAFRYALLLDPSTGKLERLVWLHDPTGRPAAERIASDLEYLAEDHVQDFALYVDTDHYRLGIPTEMAFGVMCLPTGERQIAVPEGQKEVFGLARYTAQQFVDLQEHLWTFLRAVDTIEPSGIRTVSGRDVLDARRARLHQPILRESSATQK